MIDWSKIAMPLAKLEERCNILKYERDGLRSRLKTIHEGGGMNGEEKLKSTESTKILEQQLNWYITSFAAEQNKLHEEREKNKGVQAELNSRITALEMKLARSEEEKKGMMPVTKYEKLRVENVRLTKELVDSLNARQKLNKNVDELEESKRELLSRYDRYHVGLKSAKEYIQILKKEKEEMASQLDEQKESMEAEKGRSEMYQHGLKIAEKYIDDLVRERDEMKRTFYPFPTASASAFHPPHGPFASPMAPHPPMDNSFRPPPFPAPPHPMGPSHSMGTPPYMAVPPYIPTIMNALRGPPPYNPHNHINH